MRNSTAIIATGEVPTDAIVAPTEPLLASLVVPTTYNGSSHDRVRGNQNVSFLASASRTTTQTGAATTNYNHRGIHVVLDMTVPGTGSVTLSIQGQDSVSSEWYTILAGAAVTTDSTNVYKVYPGITAAANASASDVLPRTFRLLVTANNANAATYSVGYSLIV